MGASASSSNTKLGFIIFIAIMIHKAPAAFGLSSVLLKQGLSKRAARGHLIIFSLAAPLGALSTFLLVHLLGGGGIGGERGQWWTGMMLLFSGGTFLWVPLLIFVGDDADYIQVCGDACYARWFWTWSPNFEWVCWREFLTKETAQTSNERYYCSSRGNVNSSSHANWSPPLILWDVRNMLDFRSSKMDWIIQRLYDLEM